MPPTHLTSTSRALYRIFIAPTLRTPHHHVQTPLFWTPAFAPTTHITPAGYTSIRTKTFKKDTARHALTDHYTIDRAIRADYVNFVDTEGTFHPSVPLMDVLQRLNRTTEYLVQMTEPKVDEFGNLDPEDVPTCKIVTKMALREQHARKLELMRRQAKGQGAGPAAKSLELNWAIAGGDLKHRLGKLRGFLEEGRKVEVMLGPKKRGRAATEEEVREVMRSLEEVLEEVKGSKEVKREGAVGGVLMLTYEGKKVEGGGEVKENLGAPRKRRAERLKEEAEKEKKREEEMEAS